MPATMTESVAAMPSKIARASPFRGPVLTSLRVGINQIKTNRQNAKLKARINQALNEAENTQKP